MTTEEILLLTFGGYWIACSLWASIDLGLRAMGVER